LRRGSLAELASDIPVGYADFLTITNGLCFGGLCIYATRRIRVDLGHRTYDIEGFVEATLVWRSIDDDGADLLVFGEGTLTSMSTIPRIHDTTCRTADLGT
jgi:hypothetical protein